MKTPLTSDEGLIFETLETDEERFEYAQYIVNTAPDQRPEISESDAQAALNWMERQRG